MTYDSLVAGLVHHMSIRASMRFRWSDNLKPKYHHSTGAASKCDILKREGKNIKLLQYILVSGPWLVSVWYRFDKSTWESIERHSPSRHRGPSQPGLQQHLPVGVQCPFLQCLEQAVISSSGGSIWRWHSLGAWGLQQLSEGGKHVSMLGMGAGGGMTAASGISWRAADQMKRNESLKGWSPCRCLFAWSYYEEALFGNIKDLRPFERLTQCETFMATCQTVIIQQHSACNRLTNKMKPLRCVSYILTTWLFNRAESGCQISYYFIFCNNHQHCFFSCCKGLSWLRWAKCGVKVFLCTAAPCLHVFNNMKCEILPSFQTYVKLNFMANQFCVCSVCLSAAATWGELAASIPFSCICF